LAQDININQRIISELRAENGTLGAQWAEHAHHLNDFSNNAKMNQAEGECLHLRSHLSYLTNKLNVVEQDIQRLNTKAVAKSIGKNFLFKESKGLVWVYTKLFWTIQGARH
jgi:outer membrane murein-binding lipoprotein Lpp